MRWCGQGSSAVGAGVAATGREVACQGRGLMLPAGPSAAFSAVGTPLHFLRRRATSCPSLSCHWNSSRAVACARLRLASEVKFFSAMKEVGSCPVAASLPVLLVRASGFRLDAPWPTSPPHPSAHWFDQLRLGISETQGIKPTHKVIPQTCSVSHEVLMQPYDIYLNSSIVHDY